MLYYNIQQIAWMVEHTMIVRVILQFLVSGVAHCEDDIIEQTVDVNIGESREGSRTGMECVMSLMSILIYTNLF